MNAELNTKYHEKGIFRHEELILLEKKSKDLMNDLAPLGADLNVLEEKSVSLISDKIHNAFVALVELRNLLQKEISKSRESLANNGQDKF